MSGGLDASRVISRKRRTRRARRVLAAARRRPPPSGPHRAPAADDSRRRPRGRAASASIHDGRAPSPLGEALDPRLSLRVGACLRRAARAGRRTGPREPGRVPAVRHRPSDGRRRTARSPAAAAARHDASLRRSDVGDHASVSTSRQRPQHVVHGRQRDGQHDQVAVGQRARVAPPPLTTCRCARRRRDARVRRSRGPRRPATPPGARQGHRPADQAETRDANPPKRLRTPLDGAISALPSEHDTNRVHRRRHVLACLGRLGQSPARARSRRPRRRRSP